MYIPFLNVLNVFFCIYNLNIIPIEKKNEFKMVGYLFGYGIPTALATYFLYRIAIKCFPSLLLFLDVLSAYLVPLIMSYGLIKFQEKYVFKMA